MAVYIVRHAQSTFNESGDTRYDVPLSEKGKEQSKCLNIEADIVIVSPLLRTMQTLEYSNIKYKKLIIMNELREELNGNIINYLNNEPIIHESSNDRLSRIEAIITNTNNIIANYKSSTNIKNPIIIIISHHGILQILTNKYFCNAEIYQCNYLFNI